DRDDSVSVDRDGERRAADRLGEAGAGVDALSSPSATRLRADCRGRAGEQSAARDRRVDGRAAPAGVAADARLAQRHAAAPPERPAALPAILGQRLRLTVLLAVFNMVPIPPLDGGNVLAGLLPRPLASSFNQLRPYGFVLLYALILTGGFEHIVVPPYRFIVSWLPTK